MGLIFAYLGEGEPPPLRRFPDFEREGVLEVGIPEYWPCNFFNRLDNACDGAHVPFTHRESGLRVNRPLQARRRKIIVEETEYGIKTTYDTLPGQTPTVLRFHMPNINQTKSFLRVEGSLEDSVNLIADRLFWRLPVDDQRCVSFVVDHINLVGEAAEKYRGRRLEARQTMQISPNEIGTAILEGKLSLQEVDPKIPIYYLFWVEDYVVQVGQGPIADRPHDTLGEIDRGVFILRKIWDRELRALAEGRAVKQWASPSETRST